MDNIPRMLTSGAVLVVYAVVAIVLGVLLWQSLFGSEVLTTARPEQTERNLHGDQAPPVAHSRAEETIAEYTRVLAVFTGLLVLATIALFVSGERNVKVATEAAKAAQDAANAARASVDLAQVTATRQLRAYLVFDVAAIYLNSRNLEK
jgi:hypothetical protein